ncbi:MAG: hypothetical protein ACI87E_001482 [Mariniblastus sp.]
MAITLLCLGITGSWPPPDAEETAKATTETQIAENAETTTHPNSENNNSLTLAAKPKPAVSDDAFRDAALKGNASAVRNALDSGSDANAADAIP